MRITFNLKKPRGDRASFAVNRREQKLDGSSRYTPIKNEQIDSINRAYQAGHLTEESATSQLKLVIKGLYREIGKAPNREAFNSENAQLLDRYWGMEYTARQLVDAASMYNDLRRAVAAVGALPLQSASRQDLQKKINGGFKDFRKHRRVVARLNQLLRFAGRDFKLIPMKKQFSEIRHVTIEDFRKLSKKFEGVEKLVFQVAFGTGLRLGEIFALTKQNLRKDSLSVVAQIDRQGQKRLTKTRKERLVYVIPEMQAPLKEWLPIPTGEKLELRNLRWADMLKDACLQLWQKETTKHLTFHDLRHSYAIHLLGNGASISAIAQMLGDSLQVAQESYIGFSATEESIAALAKLFRS